MSRPGDLVLRGVRALGGALRDASVRRIGRPLLLGLAVLAVAGVARPQEGTAPLIDVRKAADRRIQIGIGKYPELSGDEVGSPPGEVLGFDFELTGWFQPVLAGALPPQSLGDWARLGAELVAEVTRNGGTLDAAIRDVGTGDILFRHTYPAAPGSTLRRRLHAFADDAVLALTGQRGLASTRIACEWDPGNGKRIVLMDIDGFGMRELTKDGVLELAPRWSPDGRKVLYTSYKSGYPDVYVQDVGGGTRVKTAHFEGLNAQGDLAPDGRTIVLMLSFQGNPDIYTKEVGSDKVHRLTNHPATDTTPVWSPDGRRIAFVSDRAGTPQVYVMGADGSNPSRVTLRGNYNTAPDWSPDGTRLAYCALRPDGFQIQVIDLESRGVTTVTDVSGCEDPSWSPDGRSILFTRKAGGRADLYVTDLDERRTLRVTRGSGRYTAPDWSPIP